MVQEGRPGLVGSLVLHDFLNPGKGIDSVDVSYRLVNTKGEVEDGVNQFSTVTRSERIVAVGAGSDHLFIDGVAETVPVGDGVVDSVIVRTTNVSLVTSIILLVVVDLTAPNSSAPALDLDGLLVGSNDIRLSVVTSDLESQGDPVQKVISVLGGSVSAGLAGKEVALLRDNEVALKGVIGFIRVLPGEVDNRVTRLQFIGLHGLDQLRVFGEVGQLVPQVNRLGVTTVVLVQVAGDGIVEGGGLVLTLESEELLQHPDDRGTLRVGDGVEHVLDLHG